MSIGVVATVYNEANALPAWLECVTPWADHVSVYHAGPQGEESDDGTIEILEKWNIPIHRGKIDDGFGVCRTAAIRSSPCDWVMVLDIDEAFYPTMPMLRCSGESTPKSEADEIIARYTGLGDWDCFEHTPRLGCKLNVEHGSKYSQLDYLKEVMATGNFDSITSIRRHWHDLTLTRPTQNWHIEPDYQKRIVRNVSHIHFEPSKKMHERLVGSRSMYRATQTQGPFFEHFHFYYKSMERDQRRHDVAIYNAINEGRKPPTKSEFAGTD